MRLAVRLLWVAGLLVSGYLTFEHYTASASLVCASGGIVNCESVTTSVWSSLAGVPVALLGLLFFVAGCAFEFGGARLLDAARHRLVGAALTGVGLVFVLYLVWAELVQLGQICTWCTAVHVITAALFLYYFSTLLADRA